jgi:hypothetical protein
MVCSICLEEIENNNIDITRCNHIFHTSCYIEYLKHNEYEENIKCPNCRSISEHIKDTYIFMDGDKKIYNVVYNGIGFVCYDEIKDIKTFIKNIHNNETFNIVKRVLDPFFGDGLDDQDCECLRNVIDKYDNSYSLNEIYIKVMHDFLHYRKFKNLVKYVKNNSICYRIKNNNIYHKIKNWIVSWWS